MFISAGDDGEGRSSCCAAISTWRVLPGGWVDAMLLQWLLRSLAVGAR